MMKMTRMLLMMTMLMMKMTMAIMAMRILIAGTVMVIICLEGVDFKDLDDHHLQVVEGRNRGHSRVFSYGSKVVLNQ